MSRLSPVVSALLLLFWAMGAAFAQSVRTGPGYYRVFGVATDDILNIRAAPTASAEVLGTFEPGAQPVEVIDIDNGWARVVVGERMGWANANYLEPARMSPVGGSALPAGLVCAGTEPFWRLDISRKSVTYSAVDTEKRVMNLVEAGGFAGVGPGTNFVVAAGKSGGITAVITDQLCSDGMSDRDYPRRIDLVLSEADDLTGLTGCCYMPVN